MSFFSFLFGFNGQHQPPIVIRTNTREPNTTTIFNDLYYCIRDAHIRGIQSGAKRSSKPHSTTSAVQRFSGCAVVGRKGTSILSGFTGQPPSVNCLRRSQRGQNIQLNEQRKTRPVSRPGNSNETWNWL